MYEFLVCSMINKYVFMHMIPPIFQSILSNLSNILLFDLDTTYPKTDKVDKIQTPPSPQFNTPQNSHKNIVGVSATK